LKKPPPAEEILKSKTAMAVLRLLVQRDMPLPLSRIAKEIGSNYITVRKHVRLLEEADLVATVQYGKRKLYKVNTPDERVLALKTFIESWNNASSP